VRTDDPDVIEIVGPPSLARPAELVIEALSPVVTPERLERIEEVVGSRTDGLVLVLDCIADPHNSSAVLRSADAFGVQTVHVIVGEHGFRASQGVSKGTHRWLDIVRYESAEACARQLKKHRRWNVCDSDARLRREPQHLSRRRHHDAGTRSRRKAASSGGTASGAEGQIPNEFGEEG
jgi:hypothetical protein